MSRRRLLQVTGSGAVTLVAGCQGLEDELTDEFDSTNNGEGINETSADNLSPREDYPFMLSAQIPAALKPDEDQLFTDMEAMRGEIQNWFELEDESVDPDLITIPVNRSSEHYDGETVAEVPVNISWVAEPSEIDEARIEVRFEGTGLSGSNADGMALRLSLTEGADTFNLTDRFEEIYGDEAWIGVRYDEDEVSHEGTVDIGIATEMSIKVDLSYSDVFKPDETFMTSQDVLINASPSDVTRRELNKVAAEMREASESIAGSVSNHPEDFFGEMAEFTVLAAGEQAFEDVDGLGDGEVTAEVTQDGIMAIDELLQDELDEVRGEYRVGYAGPTLLYTGDGETETRSTE